MDAVHRLTLAIKAIMDLSNRTSTAEILEEVKQRARSTFFKIIESLIYPFPHTVRPFSVILFFTIFRASFQLHPMAVHPSHELAYLPPPSDLGIVGAGVSQLHFEYPKILVLVPAVGPD